jgi:hypothetical protein
MLAIQSAAQVGLGRAIQARDQIEQVGATAIVDESLTIHGADNESRVLDALMGADEVLFLVDSPREFLERRYPWIALGAAVARGLPVALVIGDPGSDEKRGSPEIPTVFREMKRFPDLGAYTRDLRRRLEKQGVPDPVSVFFSYHRDDQTYLDELQQMLTPLVQNRCFSVWWDAKIKAGDLWRAEIEKNLSKAKVGVILLSKEYLSAESFDERQRKHLLRKAKQRRVTLLWVLAGHCMYEHTEFAEYKPAHQNLEKPLNLYTKAGRGKVYREICENIRKASLGQL